MKKDIFAESRKRVAASKPFEDGFWKALKSGQHGLAAAELAGIEKINPERAELIKKFLATR